MIRSPSVGLTALSFISSSAEQMYGRISSVSRIEDEGTVDASPEGAGDSVDRVAAGELWAGWQSCIGDWGTDVKPCRADNRAERRILIVLEASESHLCSPPVANSISARRSIHGRTRVAPTTFCCLSLVEYQRRQTRPDVTFGASSVRQEILDLWLCPAAKESGDASEHYSGQVREPVGAELSWAKAVSHIFR